MKIKSIKFFTLGLSLNLCIFIIQGCEKSPVGSEDISLGARKISGNINLNDGSDPTGIYVWLEQFNLSTKADQNGDFQLILPTPASQGPQGGLTGLSIFTTIWQIIVSHLRWSSQRMANLYFQRPMLIERAS